MKAVHKNFKLTFICLIYISLGYSQDCDSPFTLCQESTLTADESQFSVGFNSGCLNLTNACFFEFTTNNNLVNPSAFSPYQVNAEIIVNQCDEAGLPLDVSAAVFQPIDSADPCGPLTELVNCETSQDTLNLNTLDLDPNTQYFLIIGYNSNSPNQVCNLGITVSGAPLTINACCDANIPSGLSADLFVTGGTSVLGQETYVWQPLQTLDDFSSSSPVASPIVTTTYTVEGEVGNCVTTDEVTIEVGDAISPFNVFTPNGDGISDSWQILRIENFNSALITVYDRWGQEVYKTIGYSTPWDGTNNGKRLPTGTYYYVIELNSLEVTAEPIIGFVFISH